MAEAPNLRIWSLAEVSTKKGCLKALKFYRKYQVLHLRSADTNDTDALGALRSLFVEDPATVGDTWTVENKQSGRNKQDERERKSNSKSQIGYKTKTAAVPDQDRGQLTPHDFFVLHGNSGSNSNKPSMSSSYYVSCILQKSRAVVKRFLGEMPFAGNLPFAFRWPQLTVTLPVWVFMGHHTAPSASASKALQPMRGRPEHTDSVSHAGTWHYQCSGEKIWYVRPVEDSTEWQGNVPQLVPSGQKHAEIRCKAGDVLLINTRLWWHHTHIPETTQAEHRLSMSYARDFFCDACAVDSTNNALTAKAPAHMPEDEEDEENEDTEDKMVDQFTNIDGLYANSNVPSGQVVFLESELPDAALPRNDDPNCEVCETDDGEGCLVALRDITCGEWLSVAPSDEEDEEDEEEEEEEEQ
jgi:hypothetical protein